VFANFPKQIFSLILPITVLIIVPLSIIESHFNFSLNLVSAVGILLAFAGLIILCVNISMFVRIGKGTLAPWSPTKKLVIRGMYAHVRKSHEHRLPCGSLEEHLHEFRHVFFYRCR
jgi:hypothetical protein